MTIKATLFLGLALCLTPACQAQRAPTGGTATLAAYGVAAGLPDSRAALENAFARAGGRCLDGEGRTYRVDGTIRVSRDLCLSNAQFVQVSRAPDVGAYVSRACAANDNPEAAWSCGDPALPASRLGAVERALSVRTFLIRPDGGPRLSVRMSGVSVDRGNDPSAGSRSDAAGLWIEGARSVSLTNLDVRGDGKGIGLFVYNSSNVTMDGVRIHDMRWSPYRGERALSTATLSRVGWNSAPIHEFRRSGNGGAFRGVRVQEQLVGLWLQDVSGARLKDIRIERIEAKLADGTLPWQTDGLDIGGRSNGITIEGLDVSRTWEGVDISGRGVRDVRFLAPRVRDSFAFGIKVGHDVSGVAIERPVVDGAGIAGIAITGNVRGTRVTNASLSGIGSAPGVSGRFAPWPAGNRSGVFIDAGDGTVPGGVTIEGLTVSGSGLDYGLLDRGARGISVKGLSAPGARQAARSR